MNKFIGISGNVVELEYPKNKIQDRVIVGDVYVKSIETAGGIPIIIPIMNRAYIKEMAKKIDGLVLTGGGDILPELYGEQSTNHVSEVSIDRDRFEIELLKEVLNLGKPVLGICRGMQLINIAFGGTLYQDISDLPNLTNEHWQSMEPYNPVHSVQFENKSILYNVFGDSIKVNSFHHQSVKRVAHGFKVTAWSNDGLVEAIEKEADSFVLGVQWHPEEMTGTKFDMSKLFKEFIKNT